MNQLVINWLNEMKTFYEKNDDKLRDEFLLHLCKEKIVYHQGVVELRFENLIITNRGNVFRHRCDGDMHVIMTYYFDIDLPEYFPQVLAMFSKTDRYFLQAVDTEKLLKALNVLQTNPKNFTEFLIKLNTTYADNMNTALEKLRMFDIVTKCKQREIELLTTEKEYLIKNNQQIAKENSELCAAKIMLKRENERLREENERLQSELELCRGVDHLQSFVKKRRQT